MKKIRLVFLAAFLLFLDVATMPNVCDSPKYYLKFDIKILNVEQTENLFFAWNYGRNLVSIEKNDSLTFEEVESITSSMLNIMWFVDNSDVDNYREYKVVVNSLEIVSVLDRDKNEIVFPQEINKNSFTKGSHKTYYYEITINVNIDYELESLE